MEPRFHSRTPGNYSGSNREDGALPDNGCVFFTGLPVDICPKSLSSRDKTKTNLSPKRHNPFGKGSPAKTIVDKRPNRLPQDGRDLDRDRVEEEEVRICLSCGNQMPAFIFGQKRVSSNGLQFGGAGPSRNQDISAAGNGLEEANRTFESADKPRPKEDTGNGSQSRMSFTPPEGKRRSRRRANRNRTVSFKPVKGRGRQKLELDLTELRAAFASVYEAPRELMYLGTEDV